MCKRIFSLILFIFLFAIQNVNDNFLLRHVLQQQNQLYRFERSRLYERGVVLICHLPNYDLPLS